MPDFNHSSLKTAYEIMPSLVGSEMCIRDSIRLQNGALLLVYNNSMSDRNPLTVALSEDKDATWPWKRDIAKGKDSFAYPVAIQTRDGLIHVVYTSNQRKVVNHAVFSEEWLKSSAR